jgi:hypothetical protein
VRRLSRWSWLLPLALQAACLAQGQPIAGDGTGDGSAGGAGTAGASGAGAGNGGAGGEGGAPACSASHLSGACNACAQSQCCDALENCAADSRCQALLGCINLNNCWSEGGLYTCAETYCPSLYEDSFPTLAPFELCLRSACATDC